MTGETWPRLGLIVVEPLLKEDIRQTIEALVREDHHRAEWDAHWRFKAANHLQRLIRCRAALKALAARRGRPPTLNAKRIALASARNQSARPRVDRR
jgi:hypothetical protein